MSLSAIQRQLTPMRLLLGMLAIMVLVIFFTDFSSAPLAVVTVVGLFATLLAMIVRSLWRFAAARVAAAPDQPAVAGGQGQAGAPARPDPYGALLIGHFVAAAVFAVGGLSLLGLPGLLVYATASPFVNLIFGPRALDELPMYGGLAVGFWVNIGWPWCLPAAYAAARGLKRARPRANALIYIGVLYGWALVSSFAAYLLVRSGS